jgi:glycine/D-amino acid oxidase-like deaminating enzyme
MSSADVIVIGGGLHGCSAALHLARAGSNVVVLEKDHVARHASGVNAGGVRRLGRHLAEVPLSVASMEIWHRIEELVDDSCGFEAHGQVKVAESEADLEKLLERATQVRAIGFEHEELIDARELRELLPAVAPQCVGGLVSRRDGAALPFRTTLAFKRKAEQLKVRFHEGTRVKGLKRSARIWKVETDRGVFEGPVVVNAAGAWGGQIAALLDEPVPIEAAAYMLMITAPVAPFVKPVVGATSRSLSFKQFSNGTVLIGGGHKGRAWPDTNRTALDLAKLALNAQIAAEVFPCMRHAEIVRAWAGIEGRMSDDIPVIGPSGTSEGVVHSFGYSAHGFQLGPICGSIIADLVTTGSTRFDIEPFRIGRFGG